MTRIVRATILTVLDGDEELYDQLLQQGFVPHDEATLKPHHVEVARVTQTLVRELDINWAGVEVVLRLRNELHQTRKQVSELLRLLAQKGGEP
jgi:hypothetical protein